MTDPTVPTFSCTCFKLRKLTRTMSRLYDQHLAGVGLKTTQYSVLSNAARTALPVAELAERLGMERTTLTRNLKPLIEAGWMALLPGADGRQRIVTITQQGRAKMEAAYGAWCAAQSEFETLVGADAVRALHGQLDSTLSQVTPLIEEMRHAEP